MITQPAPLAVWVSPALPPWRRLPSSFMRFLLLLLIPNLLTRAQTNALDQLGVIYRTNTITWTDPNNYGTNFEGAVMIFRGYNVYVGDVYASSVNRTNLKKLGMVTTNLWPGTTMQLDGDFAAAVTIEMGLVVTNVSTFTLTTNIYETEFSPLALVTLRNGLPVPVGNFQLFTVMQVMATNSLPALAPASPVPIPTAIMPSRTGSEYELSGR